MIDLRNQRILVVGLARSGRAAAHRLAREGARVTVTDTRPPSAFAPQILKDLMAQKIGLELGLHRPEAFLEQDLIVVSPGVPWDLSPLEAARRAGIRVAPEIEAASWFFQGTLVGITGTNGKTTATALLGKMFEASGYPTFVAGNIGTPLISAVDLLSPESIAVAELSSFQLEGIQDFRPNVAVLLNIAENHLDRHRTFSAYVSAKTQIFRNQKPEDYAILNADDPTVMGLVPTIPGRKIFFSLEQDLPEGVLASRGRILYRVAHLERVLMEEREIGLRGRFNVQNVMAAAAAACVLGADFKAIRKAVLEFTGVEHRLERVRCVRGVEFYNDSKATSVDAAAKALSTFDRGVHLILGGKDKG
ncbi:MAG: UDP-N-acetylmuramoyl-L-alanine--D-glutamate ligase, partial [Terriglobia bacterium]